MNKVELKGNLVKDVEVKEVGNGQKVANFRVAVNSDFGTNYIDCTVWNEQADKLGEKGLKGNTISLKGSLKSGSYEKDGVKQYTTKVSVSEFEISEKAKEQTKATTNREDR